MSDIHSAIIRPQQSVSETAEQCDIIPEGFRHPLPNSTRGLVTIGDRPVEDLEARFKCLICDVLYWKLFVVSVLFCVTSLTTDRTSITNDGAFGIYKMKTKHYDSKD